MTATNMTLEQAIEAARSARESGGLMTCAMEEAIVLLERVETLEQKVKQEYNNGLDTAYRIAQEVVGDTLEGETLLCGIVSSKKSFKDNVERMEG